MEANRDQNHVPSALGTSSVDGVTTLPFKIDPVTGRLLTDSASGSGTVTQVSVVTANGFAGTVADDTTTPAITLTTTVTGILKGNGTAIFAATAGTDYVTASSTNTFTNKTYDTAGTGNSFSINGTAITAVTGTGAVVLATNPTISGFTITDATNIVLNTTTGTKIGTATTQKLGFYNATPIVQPTGSVITALQNLGLVASATIPASTITSGAALTKTDDTNVTLTLGGTPTTALLVAASLTLGWTGQLALTRGGTNASLTASNGGIVYSTSTAFAILAGTATAGQILRSGSSAAPSWSTATYPSTAGTSGNVLTSDGTNWVSSAPSAGSSTKTMMSSVMESTGRFTKTGDGTITFNTTGAVMATGSSAASNCIEFNMSSVGNGNIFDRSPTFTTVLLASNVSTNASAAGEVFIGIGTAGGATNAMNFSANDHIGWKLLKVAGVTSLYATQASSSTENASSALTTVTDDDFLELILVVNSTTSVDYYWRKNGGALSSATNLTSNLPTSAETRLNWANNNKSTAFVNDYVVVSWSYSR